MPRPYSAGIARRQADDDDCQTVDAVERARQTLACNSPPGRLLRSFCVLTSVCHNWWTPELDELNSSALMQRMCGNNLEGPVVAMSIIIESDVR